MSRERVARLRQLMAEATPSRPVQSAAEVDGWRAYNHFITNVPAPQLEASARELALRRINRIATWYGWGNEVQCWLDKWNVTTLAALDDDAIEALDQRLMNLEECVQIGMGAPDAPPAY